MDTVNKWFSAAPLTEDDIVSTWAGLRPLLNEEGKPSSVSRDYQIEVNGNGLVTVAGGKLTTYRSMAETVVNEIGVRFGARLDRSSSQCQTAHLPLFGGGVTDFDDYASAELQGLGDRWGLSRALIERLLHHYGTDYLKILSLGLVHPGLLEPLSPECLVLKGEVIYALEDEMAMTVEDFMARRTELKQLDPDAGRHVAHEVARLMGKRLGWGETEKRRQLEPYRQAVEETLEFRASPVPVY